MLAVALLLSHPNVSIDAITVVNGLADVDAGARNMGRLLGLAGRKNVPLFAGRSTPLRGAAEFPGECRKISDDLIQILALGPLTNIAEALERDHSIAGNIDSIARNSGEIVSMGGAARVPGNLQDGGAFNIDNRGAEWNIFIDPPVHRSDGGPHRISIGRVVAGVLKADREILQPGMVKMAAMHIEIGQDATEAGRTKEAAGKPNANVGVDADAAAFRALFLESFAR